MNDENLRIIYEQYWLHARHQETSRLWFSNVYAVIVAGVFAYLGYAENHIFKISLLSFLAVLSLFGYIMTHSWNIPFVIFSRLAEEIAICEWNLPEKYRRFSKSRKGDEFYKGIGFGKISIRISAARVFMAFYSLMIGIIGALICQILCTFTCCQTISIAAILFALFYLYYHLYWEPKTIGKIQRDFESIIEKCSQESLINTN